MDGPREQIEVELTSHGGGPAPRPSDDPPPVEEPVVETPVTQTERGRLVVVGVGAAVVALAAGFLLGRSTAPAEVETAVVTTVTTTEPDPAGEALPAPGADRPETTQFSPIVVSTPTTVVGAGAVTTSFVAVDERLAESRVEIVMRAAGRELLTLDLVSGELVARDVSRQPFGPPSIAVGDDWVLLPSFDEDLGATLVHTDGRVESTDLGVAWGLVSVPGTDEFWRSDDELSFGRRGSVERIRVDGTVVGPTIELPVAPLLADPSGGVIVDAPGGGVYQVTADVATKLTDGYVLAVSAAQLVVFECDGELACGYHRVDRGTGARVGIPVTDELGPDPFLRSPWQPLAASPLSPDGGALVVNALDRDGDGPPNDLLGVLDLTTGAFSELADGQASGSVAWLPDGGVVFFVDGGRLFGFDRLAGETFEVAPDVIGVEVFALRAIAG